MPTKRVSGGARAEDSRLRAQASRHRRLVDTRITTYFGRFLRLQRLARTPGRLFRTAAAGLERLRDHENPVMPHRRFTALLEHYFYRSLADHQNRMQRYAELDGACDVTSAAGAVGLTPVDLNPQWLFVRGYLLRLAFWTGCADWCLALIGQLRDGEYLAHTPQPGFCALPVRPPVSRRARDHDLQQLDFLAG